jgi:esterase FrsA
MTITTIPQQYDNSTLDELKDLVRLHLRAQDLESTYCQSILDKITHFEGNSPGSWVYEWSKDTPLLLHKARWLEATRLYNMARFPFVDSAERAEAHKSCVESFAQWLSTKPHLRKINISTTEGSFNVYFAGNSERKNQPLLLVSGGIVSIKEQWVAFLEKANTLGMAVAVTEMPGVGENTWPYGSDAWKMFSILLDRLSPMADVTNTFVVAFSFSGHMAIQCALADNRIKGISTVGAPIHHFFTDQTWWNKIPLTTKSTLAHLLRVEIDNLFPVISSMALAPSQLKSLSIPLNYIFSRRDEIIPTAEKSFLQQYSPKLKLKEFNDVHGSPNHLQEMQLWIPLSILSQRSNLAIKTIILRLLFFLHQSKRIFSFKV